MTATAGLVVVLVLSFSAPALGQSATRPRTVNGPPIEYGTTSELRDVQYVFVDAGPSIREQQEIVKRLQKSIPSLTVVRDPADADIFIIYKIVTYRLPGVAASTTTVTYSDGSSRTDTQAGPQTESRLIAVVEKPLAPNRVRLLMEYDRNKTSTTEKITGPLTVVPFGGLFAQAINGSSDRDRFLRQFVDAWKKANGIK
jgi:hypothetical protein